MTLLVTVLWPALLASLALGILVGGLTGLPRIRPARLAALGLGIAAIVLSGLALSGMVPGRPGFWVESAALDLDAYLTGAVIGAGLAMARKSAA